MLNLIYGATEVELASTGSGAGIVLENGTLTGVAAEHISRNYPDVPLRAGVAPDRMAVSNRVITATLNIYGTSAADLAARRTQVQGLLARASRSWIEGGEGVYIEYNTVNRARVYGGQLTDLTAVGWQAAGRCSMAVGITMEAEPYWSGSVYKTHNYLLNSSGQLGTFGWSTTTPSRFSVVGGTMFPTCFRLQEGAGVAFAYGEAINLVDGDVLLLDAILAYDSGAVIRLDLVTDIGTTPIQLTPTVSGEHVYGSWTVPIASGIDTARIYMRWLSGSVSGYFEAIRLQRNVGTARPLVHLSSTTIQMGATGQIDERKAGNAVMIYAPASYCDGPIDAAIRWQPVTAGGGTPSVGRVLIGKQSVRPASITNCCAISNNSSGYYAGAHTATAGSLGTAWENADAIQWTPALATTEEEIARWDLSALPGQDGSLPTGRVAVFAVCNWPQVTTGAAMLPSLGVGVQIGSESYTVDRWYALQNEAASSQPPRLIYVGDVDLDGGLLPNGYVPGARSIVVKGKLGQPTFGGVQKVVLDYLLLVPVGSYGEAQGHEAQVASEYAVQNAGFGQPLTSVHVYASSPTKMNYAWENYGEGLQVNPGEISALVFAFARYGDAGVVENNRQAFVELQLQPRFVLPQGGPVAL